MAPPPQSDARARAIAFGVLAVAAGILLVPSFLRGESFTYDGAAAAPFSLSYEGLEEGTLDEGELLDLRGRDGDAQVELTIEPLSAELNGAGDAAALAALALERVLPEGVKQSEVLLEGRTRVGLDRGPRAHQIAIGATGAGGSTIGRVLFVPAPEGSELGGVTIRVLERTTDETVVAKLAEARSGLLLNWPFQIYLESEVSVRTSELLEEPLQSFSWE